MCPQVCLGFGPLPQFDGILMAPCAAAAHEADRAALAADYDKRAERLEQEQAHRVRALERKHAKK